MANRDERTRRVTRVSYRATAPPPHAFSATAGPLDFRSYAATSSQARRKMVISWEWAEVAHGGQIIRHSSSSPAPRTQQASPSVPAPERTSESRVRAAVAEAWRFYTLPKLHARGIAYLAKRNIDVKDLEAVTGKRVVGHTPHQQWPATRLVDHLRKRGFTDTEMLDAGLASTTKAGIVCDAYRDRVVVPVCDDAGRPIALIGRYVEKRDAPKYLNPSRTVTYDKSRDLYRPAIVPLDPDGQVVVVEGTLDALHLAAVAAQAGRLSEFAVVTSSGLALQPEAVAKVMAMSDRAVVLAADGDAPGAKANIDWAVALLQAGRQSAIVSLPRPSRPPPVGRESCRLRPGHLAGTPRRGGAARLHPSWRRNRSARRDTAPAQPSGRG